MEFVTRLCDFVLKVYSSATSRKGSTFDGFESIFGSLGFHSRREKSSGAHNGARIKEKLEMEGTRPVTRPCQWPFQSGPETKKSQTETAHDTAVSRPVLVCDVLFKRVFAVILGDSEP